MAVTDARFARRLADRIGCVRRGHAWETIEVTLGELSLLRTDCTRCGQVGPLHGAPITSSPRDDRCVGADHAGMETGFQMARENRISTMNNEASGRSDTLSHDTHRIDGFGVEARDGSIGTVDEATYDVGSGYIVVNTGPWIFGKKVLLPATVVEQIDSDEEEVYVSLTTDEIKDSPEFDAACYRDQSYLDSVAACHSRHRMKGAPQATARPRPKGLLSDTEPAISDTPVGFPLDHIGVLRVPRQDVPLDRTRRDLDLAYDVAAKSSAGDQRTDG